MKKNIKICFVGNLSQTFVKNDYEILRKRFKVNVSKPPRKTKGWIRFLYKLFKNTKKAT